MKFIFSDQEDAVPDGVEILQQDLAASYQKNPSLSRSNVVNRKGYKIFRTDSFVTSLLYITNSPWHIQSFGGEHIESVRRIYNDNIRNTPYSLETIEQDESYFFPYLPGNGSKYHDLFVVCENGRVLGYGGLYPFSKLGGYQYTREIFCYIDKDYQRKGIGRFFFLYLEEVAIKRSLSVIIGLIESRNIASKSLVEKLGYQLQGQLPRIGYKFNRFLTFDLYQKFLRGRASLSGTAYDVIDKSLSHFSFYQDFRTGIIDNKEYQLILEKNMEALLLTELNIDLIYLSARTPYSVAKSVDDTLNALWQEGIISEVDYNKREFVEFSDLVVREFYHGHYLTYIFPEEAQLLYALVDLAKPKRIAVIGSFYGFWASWAAAALSTSDLIYLVDPNHEVLELAKDNMERLKIKATIEYVAADALKDEVQFQELDMIILDAEGPESHPENSDIAGKAIYFPLIQKFFYHMSPGGLLVTHNMLLNNITLGKYFEEKIANNKYELRKFIDFLNSYFSKTYIYDSTEGMSISLKG